MPTTIIKIDKLDAEAQPGFIVLAVKDTGNDYWIHFTPDQADRAGALLSGLAQLEQENA